MAAWVPALQKVQLQPLPEPLPEPLLEPWHVLP
jgi:hypothetical protein